MRSSPKQAWCDWVGQRHLQHSNQNIHTKHLHGSMAHKEEGKEPTFFPDYGNCLLKLGPQRFDSLSNDHSTLPSHALPNLWMKLSKMSLKILVKNSSVGRPTADGALNIHFFFFTLVFCFGVLSIHKQISQQQTDCRKGGRP